MSDEEYSALEFGKVLATLDAQNRVLATMQADIKTIFSLIAAMQQAEAKKCKEAKESKGGSDWGKELIAAILGAVAYFVFDYFVHGGK